MFIKIKEIRINFDNVKRYERNERQIYIYEKPSDRILFSFETEKKAIKMLQYIDNCLNEKNHDPIITSDYNYGIEKFNLDIF